MNQFKKHIQKIILGIVVLVLIFGISATYASAHKSRTFNLRNQYGLLMDGVNELLTINNHASINFEGTNAFSISAWVKLTNINKQQIFVDKRDTVAAPNTKTNYVFFMDSSNRLSFLIQNTATNRLHVRNTANTLSAGVWYHLVVTYDGSRTAAGVNLYINNSSVAVTSVTDALTATSQSGGTLGIGALNAGGTPGSYLDGVEDEVAIFNAQLTAAQVSEIYNGGNRINLNAHSKAANLAAYWRMSDPDAAFSTNWSIPDDSPNSNTATSVNMEVGDRATGANL